MDKVVIVTGASSGIGLSMATYLSNSGFKVYGGSRKAPHSDVFTSLEMDVTSDKSVSAAIKSIIKKEGRIDVLINNAGVGSAGAIEVTPIADIQKSFDVNFFGAIRVTQEVLPYMRKQKCGKIINMSTLGSMIGLPFRAFYSSSKGAMDLVTETLRMELERFGIQACTIHPGEVMTDISSHRIVSQGKEDPVYGKTFDVVFGKLDASVSHGINPDTFGPLVVKIIASKNVKRNYYLGSFSEVLGLKLKKYLPYYLYERILRSYFKS